MTDEQRAARGHRAFNELTELQDVFERLEQAVFKSMQETSPIGCDVKVQRLHMTLHNFAAIRQAMREMIDDGKMAEAAISMAGLTRQN